MRIYTKTGDAGETGLVGGDRIGKASLRVTAIGDLDELNAAIGLARAATTEDPFDQELGDLQSRLFDLGAEVACPPEGRIQFASVGNPETESLERSIDAMTVALPPLTHFILPGGSEFAARLHLARTVCRRAERSLLALHAVEPARPETLRFLNRLSDWLFVAARTANARQNVEDVPWSGTTQKS